MKNEILINQGIRCPICKKAFIIWSMEEPEYYTKECDCNPEDLLEILKLPLPILI